MPTAQKDFNALQNALRNSSIEDLNEILQNFDLTATDKDGRTCLMLCGGFSSSPEVVKVVLKKIEETGGPDLFKSQLTATDNLGRNCLMFCSYNSKSAEVVKLVLEKIEETGGPDLFKSLVAATDKDGRNCLMLCGGFSSSPEVVKVVLEKIEETGGPDLFKSLVAATDSGGRNCLMLCCRSSSPEVVKLILEKIEKTGGPDLFKTLVAATDKDGRTCLMLCSHFSSSPEVVKLILEKIEETGGPDLLKSLLTATDNIGWTCLMFCCAGFSSAEVMKLFAVVLFHFDLFKIQYLPDNYKRRLKEKAGIDSSSWTPDAASLAEVKAILQGADPAATKKKADEEAAAKMPTTQEDFNALQSALKNNNIEDAKKILQNFDVTATDNDDWNCLMLCSRYSSSPEVVKVVLEKIEETGGPDLLKRLLAATDGFGRNCLMLCGYFSQSPEVVKLVLEKIEETGGPNLLKSQLTATSNDGRNCLMHCCVFSKSPEVTKLFAVVLFHLDLFKIQFAKLDDKLNLKRKAGIDSSSWAPDAASLAEVKAILQGADPAAAKKKSEEEAAAKKKAESQSPPSAPLPQEDPASFHSPPPSRCFKRGVPDKSLEDSVKALFSIKDAPEKRPDLKNWIPDKEDARNLLHYLKTALPNLKERPAIKKLIAENGLTDDDIKILHSYKIQNPYPVYLWLNGWLGGDRRDDFVKEHVAPFFVLLYRAMEKLPHVKTVANRAIKLNGIPALKNTYDNYERVCAPEKTLSFWGFSSFSTKSDVVNREEFVGKPVEQAIVYSCGKLEGVDMEPFAPEGLKNESEILPLCPCVLEVTTAVKMGQKLIVGVKQLDHAHYSYVVPK